MAKGNLNGLLTGKLGNTIFYKVTNSANKEKQGSRQYVATIANPKTAPQASQRMRMKPAINFYRGLADLLDHSWEGVKYGALSRQKFMQLALSPTLEGIPYVDKGETRFIPGEYPVSLGSVSVDASVDSFTSIDSSNQNVAHLTSIVFSDEINQIMSWGEWSQVAIDNSNGQLRDGDELTFIAVYQNGDYFLPRHTYIVLDVSNTLPAWNVLSAARIVPSDETFGYSSGEFVEDGEEGVTFSRVTEAMVAAAVIVSRHPSRTSTTWLRSSSTMKVSDAFKAVWMSADRFAIAQATYMSSETDLTSDWLLNQAENASGSSSGGGGGLIQDFTIESRNTTEYGDSEVRSLAYYNDGEYEGFLCDSLTLIEQPEGSTDPTLVMCTNVYTLSGQTLNADGNATFSIGSGRRLPLDQYPTIRAKIAKFYTFNV